MHVGVIGAGGGGSLVIEQLAHLGVGRITAVDFDRVETTNLSRIVGATAVDAQGGVLKVEVARRVVTQVDSSIDYRGLVGDLTESAVVDALLACDFLFLATDTVRARLVFNSIAHQYLIPGIQIGSKVELGEDGSIEEVYVAVRPVFPDCGCLDCAGLIDPFALQREQLTEEEAEAQNYVGAPGQEEVVDPSVISLNAISASHAVTDMFLVATGLTATEALAHRIFFPRDGSMFTVDVHKRVSCLFCSSAEQSVFGRGDARQLPVRPTSAVSELQPSKKSPVSSVKRRSFLSRLRRRVL
jgi:ThiF family